MAKKSNMSLLGMANASMKNAQEEKRFTSEKVAEASEQKGTIYYASSPQKFFLSEELLDNRVLHTRTTHKILKESILSEGLKEPLIVIFWADKFWLLDGFTRLEVYKELGLDTTIPYRLVKPQSWNSTTQFLQWAIAYMDTIQDTRRAYTRLQNNYNIGKQYASLKNEQGGDRRSEKIKVQNLHFDPLTEIMSKFSVSRRTVFNAYQFYMGACGLIPSFRQQVLVGNVKPFKTHWLMELGKLIERGEYEGQIEDIESLRALVEMVEEANEEKPTNQFENAWGKPLWEKSEDSGIEILLEEISEDQTKAISLYYMLKARFEHEKAEVVRQHFKLKV